jgi:hypothetical protein
MDSIVWLLDVLFAFGGITALGFLAYGGWLAFGHSQGFLQEGQGRFEQRHVRRARHKARRAVARA